jgi:hypothetical protein
MSYFMGQSKQFFMEIEDFERDAQKDQLYLLEQLAEEAEMLGPPRLKDEAIIIFKPKRDDSITTVDNPLPF